MDSTQILFVVLYCGFYFYLRWRTYLSFRLSGLPPPPKAEWHWELFAGRIGWSAVLFTALYFVIVHPDSVIELQLWLLGHLFRVGDAHGALSDSERTLIIVGLVALIVAMLASAVITDICRLRVRHRDPEEQSQARQRIGAMTTGVAAMLFFMWPVWALWLWRAIIRPALSAPLPDWVPVDTKSL